jgi:hypothetical protein
MAKAKPTYVILSECGRAIASASFWRVGDEPLAPGLMAAFLKHWLLLICRSPLSSTAGLILPNPCAIILEELSKIGRRLRRQERCCLLIFDSLNATTGRALPRTAYYRFGNQGTILHILATASMSM